MKKILLSLMLIFYFQQGYSYTNEDYLIFLEGKKAYYQQDYIKAQQNFDVLLRTFTSSDIFSNNYAFFFTGMTYYRLGDYSKAAFYLEKAVYLPKSSVLDSGLNFEKINYFAERDFALGSSFINIGNIEKGILYLNKIEYETFYPLTAYYEKKALEILKDYTPEAEKELNLKFNYDFSKISDFTVDELLKIGNFYISRKSYTQGKEYFQIILANKTLSPEEKIEVSKEYLKVLFLLKDFDTILTFTEKISPENKNLFKFYRGLTFYQLKNFSRALFHFEGIDKKSSYGDKASYYSAGIYFALGDFQNTIVSLKNLKKHDVISDTMLAFSYYYLDKKVEFSQVAQIIENKYPNTYASLYFSYLLKNIKNPPKNINSIGDIIEFANILLKDLEHLPKDFLAKADKIEIEQLSEISKLQDRELLKIAFEKSSFFTKKTLPNAYSTTVILQAGEFYNLAFKNSIEYLSSFGKYKELIYYCYPLYFQEIIDYYSKEYDIPQEMIYTIIHTTSSFNSWYVSENSRMGLMNVPFNEENSYNFFEYFDPEINIAMGCKILKEYMNKYHGNKIKSLVAYMYGESYVNSLYFGYSNDINFGSIIVPEERYFLQNMFLTYILYSKLYEF